MSSKKKDVKCLIDGNIVTYIGGRKQVGICPHISIGESGICRAHGNYKCQHKAEQPKEHSPMQAAWEAYNWNVNFKLQPANLRQAPYERSYYVQGLLYQYEQLRQTLKQALLDDYNEFRVSQGAETLEQLREGKLCKSTKPFHKSSLSIKNNLT